MQGKKYLGDVDRVPTTVTLTTVPLTFLAGMTSVDLPSIWKDCTDYRLQSDDCDKTEHAGNSRAADLKALFDGDLLWSEAGDVDSFMEEKLLVTSSLVSAVGQQVPVFRQRYMQLLRLFAGEVQWIRSKCKTTSRELAERYAKMEGL